MEHLCKLLIQILWQCKHTVSISRPQTWQELRRTCLLWPGCTDFSLCGAAGASFSDQHLCWDLSKASKTTAWSWFWPLDWSPSYLGFTPWLSRLLSHLCLDNLHFWSLGLGCIHFSLFSFYVYLFPWSFLQRKGKGRHFSGLWCLALSSGEN